MSAIPFRDQNYFHNIIAKVSVKTQSLIFSNNGQGIEPNMGVTAGTIFSLANSFYEAGILGANWTGADTFASFVAYERNGRQVSLFFPLRNGTATATNTLNLGASTIPPRLVPNTSQTFLRLTTLNSVPAVGLFIISTVGGVLVSSSVAVGTFTNAQTYVTSATTVTYLIN